MSSLIEVLRWVQLAAYFGLALLCLQLWRRHRTAAAGWVAATFGVLGVVVLVAAFLGPDGGEDVPPLVAKVLIAFLLLFPLFLYRFTATLVNPPRWADAAAAALTAVVAVWTLLLPDFPAPDAPLTGPFRAYLIGFLVQWSVLSLTASVSLWVAGRGEPGLPRRRMRLLALAAMGLNLTMILSASVNGGRPEEVVEIVTQVMGIVGAGFFYVAFAPPRVLRTAWRRREQELLQEAAVGVSAATSVEGVTQALLPHVAPVFGGQAAVLAGPDGSVLGAYGVDRARAERIGRELAAEGSGRLGPDFMAIRMRSGWLAVEATPFTPFFGQGEVELLSGIGAYVDLALDRTSLFAAERDARADLERANGELEAFLYSVSHDLKSPLVSLSGYLSYLTQDYGEVLGAGGREYLDRMAANAGYMQNLIQDLLELSRVGRIQVEATDVDLRTLVEDVATEVRQADGVAARVEIGSLPVLSMNPVRARQLFTNLLDNAVVHGGRPDITIRVRATESPDGSVVVSVSDDGIGIPERYREKVFGVFERLEGRRGRGTGIGLAVCRKIVESIGGRIWIAVSEQGTDIRIEMPAIIVHGWHAEVGS